MINISVIIPVYNGAQNLIECLESVLGQANITTEVLCIDDGSVDESLHILERYALEHSNIKIIANEHQGVSFSRNQGIDLAQGEYVCFMDADDLYASSDVLSYLYMSAKHERADIVGGCFSDFSKDSVTRHFDGDLCGYTFQENGWIFYNDYQFDYGFHRFLFRREFLVENEIYFPKLLRFQDPPFLVRALDTAGKFWGTNKIVYQYRLSDKAFVWSEKKICDCIHGIVMNLNYAKNKGYKKLTAFSICRLIRLLYDDLRKDSNQKNKFIRLEMNLIRFYQKDVYDTEILTEDDRQKFEELLEFYRLNKNPKLTVVVPAYNVADYLRQCLDSLVYQTCYDHKIIVINDGSTDETPSICMEYAMRYPRFVTYISQENRGLGATRNIGIDLVDTPYISFLDSDDWHSPRFVEEFLKVTERETPDIIISLPVCYNQATGCTEPWMDKRLYEQLFIAEHTYIYHKISENRNLYKLEVNANRKIYRTDFLKDGKYRFSEGVKWEDVCFHYAVMHGAKSMIGMPQVGFMYRINSGGQITGERGKGRLDIIPVFKETLTMCKNRDFSIIDKAYVLHTFCGFTMWFLDVTDQENIEILLEGLHDVFVMLEKEVIDIFLDEVSDEPKLHKGLIRFLRGNGYLQLADYRTRQNYYYEWKMREERKYGIVFSGLKCIQQNGFMYTINLFLRKIKYDGFEG